ncbi:uncharacterized protein [Oryctolagus cuniculus]|uniref:uncharacterized protein n=1 Tax=Oryctolagus cuniculus TaxID=9986 RepID=UPI00387A58D1
MLALRCGSQEAMDTFLLHREGLGAPPQHLRVPGQEIAAQATFMLGPVTSAHRGTYRCYSAHSTDPYLWSWPSDPLQVEVSGEGPSPPGHPGQCRAVPRRGLAWGRDLGVVTREWVTAEDSKHRDQVTLCGTGGWMVLLVGVLPLSLNGQAEAEGVLGPAWERRQQAEWGAWQPQASPPVPTPGGPEGQPLTTMEPAPLSGEWGAVLGGGAPLCLTLRCGGLSLHLLLHSPEEEQPGAPGEGAHPGELLLPAAPWSFGSAGLRSCSLWAPNQVWSWPPAAPGCGLTEEWGRPGWGLLRVQVPGERGGVAVWAVRWWRLRG